MRESEGEEQLHGVTLAQYAHVLAAESEGVPTDVALLMFSVDPTSWDAAFDAWGQRIARAAVSDSPLLDELDREIEIAREQFTRRIPPLDEDVRVWMGFLEAWAGHPDPMQMLADIGLTEGDIFRLQALWGKRLASDEALRKELEAGGPLPVRLEDIRPQPREFGVAPDTASAPSGSAFAPASPPPPAPSPLGAPPPFVSPAPISPRAPLSPRSPMSGIPVSAPPSTAPIGHGPAKPAMPFQIRAASPAPPPVVSVPLEATKPPVFDEEDSHEAGPPASTAGGSHGQSPPSMPPLFSSTSEYTVPAIPSAAVLPFTVPGLDDEESTLLEARSPPPPRDPAPRDPAPRDPAPRDPAPRDPAPRDLGKRTPLDTTTQTISPFARQALPFVPAPTPVPQPADPAGELSLRNYARVCAEVALFPARSEEIFARYGLANRIRRAEVDRAWRARLDADKEAYVDWRREYTKHQKRYRDRGPSK